MSKTLKNIITAFSALCMIVLVVFCVELFLLNRDSSAGRNSTLSNGESNDPLDDAPTESTVLIFDDLTGSRDPVFSDTFGDENSIQIAGPAVPPPPNAQRESFMLSPNIAELVFYVDMELFDLVDLGDGLYYSYLSDDNVGLEIGFAFVHPQGGISFLAENYLNNYLDGGESVVLGERPIGRSQVRGIFVSGDNQNVTYNAWLISLANYDLDTLALVVVVKYESEAQSEVLNSILDTMFINTLSN